jgi:PAS domain S-box-containing protein
VDELRDLRVTAGGQLRASDSDGGEQSRAATDDGQADIRRLNEELQRRVTELETMFELAPVGLAISRDAECLHIEPNPAFRRLLRLPLDANASRSAPPDQRPANFRVLQDGVELAPEDLPMQVVARTGLPINGSECHVEFDDGTVAHLLGSTAPLFDEQARPRGCIGAFVDITDRKRAEQALREERARLRLALEAARMGTWSWDIANGTNDWNDEMYRQLGYTPGSVKPCYDAWTNRILPEDLAKAEAQVRDSFKHGGDYRCEYRVLDANGHVRWLEGRCRTDCDANGQPVRTYGVVIDVTAERIAAEAIRESERYVRGVLDALPEHIAVLDDRGVIEAVNLSWRRFAEANGIAASTVSVGTNYLTVCQSAAVSGDQIAGEVARLLEELLSGQRSEFSLEYPCHAPDQQRWFIMHARRNPDGRRGVVISHVDITERMLAEESIRASEARLSAALEGGRMGLWEWDVRTNTSVWNAIEYQLLGLPVGEGNVPTSLFFDRVHPDDAGPFNKILSDVMESGSEFHHEVRIRRADGQERWLAAAGQLSRDASGKPSKMIGVNYDITEQKLAAAKLCEARAEAEAANRAKDQFLAMLSHELRGPLSPVSMILAVWRRHAGDLPADFLEDVDLIERSVNSQMRLIDDLLDFNRIATGKLSIRPEPIDLHDLLRRCLEAHRESLESKGLRATCSLRATSGHITADPGRLEQVFGNVLRNAIKFTATGTIDIETHDLPDDGAETGFIRVRIRDSGVGINACVSPESLFEPFEQGGEDRTRRYGGLGLGLAICRGFIQAHGGRISAASDGPGKGTTITIDLPTVCAASIS